MTDADVAIGVVLAGAEVVHRRFGTVLERIDKTAGDFATDADVEAESAMLAVLRQRRSGDAVLGEELGAGGSSDRSRTWLIDPLCGTLNYAAGMRVVAVNAALRTNDGVLAAAVADPFSGQVFWTDGSSARLRAQDRDAALSPTPASQLVDLNFDPPFPNTNVFRAVALAADVDFNALFRSRVVSSSLALTWVASGQRAGYVTDGHVGDSVHFAAGIAICRAAGCCVSDLEGGDNPAKGLLVAADQPTHATLLRLIGRQRP